MISDQFRERRVEATHYEMHQSYYELKKSTKSNSMKASGSNNYGYNKNLRAYARKLRNNMTKAEAALWKYALKGRQRNGYQFRRQRPVLNYIADFMCKELMLVIEVDGITHHFEEVFEHDIERQIKLEEAGFKVIRFSDEEVLENMDAVVLEIDKVILSIEQAKYDS